MLQLQKTSPIRIMARIFDNIDNDPAERACVRTEPDGLVAHLYGLSEAEFAPILGTFPLVAEPTKIAALNAWRDVQTGLIQ